MGTARLPPAELHQVLFETACEHLRNTHPATVHTFVDAACDAITGRFALTPREGPIRYPPELTKIAERAATAVLEAYLAGRKAGTGG